MSSHKSLRGGDLHAPSSELIENNSGSTIAVLIAVRFNGMGTVYPQIIPANPSTDVIRGITQTAILTGTSGYITSLGFLNAVNTAAWVVGTTLYATSSGVVSNAPNGLPLATVLKQDALTGIIYVNSTGILKSDLDSLTFPDPLSLELAFDIGHPSFYTEISYDMSGIVQGSDVWDSASKTLHIFSKVFTYTTGRITRVLVTRVYDGKTLQKDLIYNGSGQVINVTRTYTP